MVQLRRRAPDGRGLVVLVEGQTIPFLEYADTERRQLLAACVWGLNADKTRLMRDRESRWAAATIRGRVEA